jgi:hypothetical protein
MASEATHNRPEPAESPVEAAAPGAPGSPTPDALAGAEPTPDSSPPPGARDRPPKLDSVDPDSPEYRLGVALANLAAEWWRREREAGRV